MSQQQVTTQDLFELIGRQTVEIDLLRKQLAQLSTMVQQVQGQKERATQENGSQGVVVEGVEESSQLIWR